MVLVVGCVMVYTYCHSDGVDQQPVTPTNPQTGPHDGGDDDDNDNDNDDDGDGNKRKNGGRSSRRPNAIIPPAARAQAAAGPSTPFRDTRVIPETPQSDQKSASVDASGPTVISSSSDQNVGFCLQAHHAASRQDTTRQLLRQLGETLLNYHLEVAVTASRSKEQAQAFEEAHKRAIELWKEGCKAGTSGSGHVDSNVDARLADRARRARY